MGGMAEVWPGLFLGGIAGMREALPGLGERDVVIDCTTASANEKYATPRPEPTPESTEAEMEKETGPTRRGSTTKVPVTVSTVRVPSHDPREVLNRSSRFRTEAGLGDFRWP